MKREISAIEYGVCVQLAFEEGKLKRTYILEKPVLESYVERVLATYNPADDHEHASLDTLAAAIVMNYWNILASYEWPELYNVRPFDKDPNLRIHNSTAICTGNGTFNIADSTPDIASTLEFEQGKPNQGSSRPLSAEELETLYFHVARLLTQ